MRMVVNNAYTCHSIEYAGCGLIYINTNAKTFRVLFFAKKLPQMIFIPRHIYPENFMQIVQKRFEL